jgi:hypothetical protein
VAWIGGLLIARRIDAVWFWQLVFWIAVALLVPTARWVPLQASALLMAALFAGCVVRLAPQLTTQSPPPASSSNGD